MPSRYSGALLASFIVSSALSVDAAVGVSIDSSDIVDVGNTENKDQATEFISTNIGSASKAYVSIYSSDKPLGKEDSFSPAVIRKYISKTEIPVQSEMQCIKEGAAYIINNSNVSSDFAIIACGSDDGSINRYSCSIPEVKPFEKSDKPKEIKCKKDIGIMAMNESNEDTTTQAIDIS